ncbi:MAG TPA: NAD-dependent epimerase/dehydratase family protein [Terracidiphilus sp.]
MNELNSSWAVTGAAGFLGSHVVDQLIARGQRVIGIDDLSAGRRGYVRDLNPAKFTLEEIDIRDLPALTRCLTRHHPAALIHLAALHFIPAAVADPARAVSINVHGSQCVFDAARMADVPALWLASTGDIYAPSEAARSEQSPTGPFNIYGLSKLMCEQLLALEAQRRPDARYVVGRLFNLYGSGETNPHFLPELLGQIKRNPAQPVRLGNLFPRRDLVPVADAARAIIESAIAAPKGFHVYNLATGVAWSMSAVVEKINELMGGRLKIETDPAKVRPVERDHLQADVSRLRALIGWTPHADLMRGLRELLGAEGLL